MIQPSPKELLYSALASCTVLTIKAFYQNSSQGAPKIWGATTLESVTCICTEVMPPDGDGHIADKVLIEITLIGTLSESNRESLIRASAFCPVKRMLAIPVDVREII